MSNGEFRMTNLPENAAGDPDPIRNSQFAVRNSIEASAGLVFRGGQLLITQRLAGSHLAGLWEFPGGKRELNESFEDCLRRELHEELGVVVHVHEEIERITHSYPEKTVHLRFFRCTLAEADAEPRAIGCQSVAWVTRATLGDYSFPAADERLLERIRAGESLWAQAQPPNCGADLSTLNSQLSTSESATLPAADTPGSTPAPPPPPQ